MNRFHCALSKIIVILPLVLPLFLLLPSTNIYAKAGCCSSHGGVAGCDATSGRLLCKDGKVSPSCGCDGSTIKPSKKPTTQKQTQPASTTTTTTTAAPTTTTGTTSTSKAKTKGCCARHGGLGQCNKATGYYMCKDGTQSATCKCS